jgi:hypothetical protein
MPRNRIDANVRCPSCNGQLYPRVLVCDSCGLKVEGDFVMNEFGSLTPDELHFLRVFIYCEGRIRDMEAALGVSYPTVKGHLASIKQKLNLSSPRFQPPSEAGEPSGVSTATQGAARGGAAPGSDVSDDKVLDGLESGQISYKEAIKMLRAKKGSSSKEAGPSGKETGPAGQEKGPGGQEKGPGGQEKGAKGDE